MKKLATREKSAHEYANYARSEWSFFDISSIDAECMATCRPGMLVGSGFLFLCVYEDIL